MSEGVGDKQDIKNIILANFPDAVKVERANVTDDKSGIDYWVTTQSGQRHGIDVKVRSKDYAQGYPPKDDIALEIWSKVDSKVGWTRDTNKRTDYILWIWLDTGRWTLVPFPMLCSVFSGHWEQWAKKYDAPIQNTRNSDGSQWQSQCVFVPRNVVWGAIYATFGGTPA